MWKLVIIGMWRLVILGMHLKAGFTKYTSRG